MRATDLDPALWNAIADFVTRSTNEREIAFSVVTRVDTQLKHIFCEDFGDLAIPLVGFRTTFAYLDTDASGTAQWRGDKSQTNDFYYTQLVLPKVGETAVILDLAGAKTHAICIGLLLSEPGFWEGD
jgi:hypothetical protein